MKKSLSEVERLRLLVAKQEVEIARLKKGYWVEGASANREYVTGSGKTTKFSKNSNLWDREIFHGKVIPTLCGKRCLKECP